MHAAVRVLVWSDVKRLANNTRSSGRPRMRRRLPFTTDDEIHARQTHTGRRAPRRDALDDELGRFGWEERFASFFYFRHYGVNEKKIQKLGRKTFFRANRVYHVFETTNRPHKWWRQRCTQKKKQNKNTARAEKNNKEVGRCC